MRRTFRFFCRSHLSAQQSRQSDVELRVNESSTSSTTASPDLRFGDHSLPFSGDANDVDEDRNASGDERASDNEARAMNIGVINGQLNVGEYPRAFVEMNDVQEVNVGRGRAFVEMNDVQEVNVGRGRAFVGGNDAQALDIDDAVRAFVEYDDDDIGYFLDQNGAFIDDDDEAGGFVRACTDDVVGEYGQKYVLTYIFLVFFTEVYVLHSYVFILILVFSTEPNWCA